MRRGIVAVALAAALSAACSADVAAPLPQWLVVVGTDAPVPQLGDRLLLEVVDDAGEKVCPSCARQFGVASPGNWPVSFGVPGVYKGLYVRARLFRTRTLGPRGVPAGPALIDAIARLPDIDPSAGIQRVVLPLRMACFGVPADPAARQSCNPATSALGPEGTLSSAPEPPAPGSWPPAAEVGCEGTAPEGMRCIPGGVFLLGDPDAPPVDDPKAATTPEHLVQLPPFFLDTHELTVDDYLAVRADHPELLEPRIHGDGSITDGAFCTYKAPDGGAMPLTCVSRSLAESICEAKSRRLPTEAEWERAASAKVSDETRYPWGANDDICKYAIVARGTVGLCLITPEGTLAPGPVAGGSADDVTELGIQNLGGNVSEWVADAFASYLDPCWDHPGLQVNPRCDDGAEDSVRGGSWASRPVSARGAVRKGADGDPSSAIGLRCAASVGSSSFDL